MKLSEIQNEVEALKTSSAFRSGDSLTFAVRVVELEAELPGPCDPEKYLDLVRRKLGVSLEKGDRVLVVGAGNGGMCAEALLAGASEVLACEPRYRYFDAIEKINRLLDEVHVEPTCRTFRGWPTTGSLDSLGRFDLVLWTEGLDECQNPAQAVTAILQLLKADGRAVIEVAHGAHGIPDGKINSFFPSEGAWIGLIEDLTGRGPSGSHPGRAENRVIYALGRNAKVGEVAPTPKDALPPFPKDAPKPAPKPETPEEPRVEGLPTFPRDSAPATVHRVGSNLPPIEEAPAAPPPAPEPEEVAEAVSVPEPEESIPVSLPEEAKSDSVPLDLPKDGDE